MLLSVTSSLTRRPLAYISSSMARSRRPSGVFTSGAASSDSTCASLKVLGTRIGWRAASSFSVGSACIRCSRSAKRKKRLNTVSRRLALVAREPACRAAA